jgi:hypothetical protein
MELNLVLKLGFKVLEFEKLFQYWIKKVLKLEEPN